MVEFSHISYPNMEVIGMFQFQHLVSRFNNGLAHPARQRVYNDLKSHGLLGRVFTTAEQKLLREFLFATDNNKYWFERTPFESCLLSEVQEARVDWFLDSFLRGRPTDGSGKAKQIKSRQLYELLRELDVRAWYIKGAPEGSFSLGLLPCSYLTLCRLREAFSEATCLEDLRDKSEDELKNAGLRNPARQGLLAFVAERLPAQAAMPI